MFTLSPEQLDVLSKRFSGVTPGSLEAFLTPPKRNVQCWLTAILYLAQTGDWVGAIAKLVTCLVEQGANPMDFVQCILDFIISVIQGEQLDTAFIQLFNCILGRNGGGNGNGGGGEVTPPNYREVKRCG